MKKFEKINFLRSKKKEKISSINSYTNIINYSIVTFDKRVAFSNKSRTTRIEKATPSYFELIINS